MVNKLPGAFPSGRDEARARPTGSDFLTVQIRLGCSASSEVTANCVSWGSHHLPALPPDCEHLISLLLEARHLRAGPASRERGRGVAPCAPLAFAASRTSPVPAPPRELSEPSCSGTGGSLARFDIPSRTLTVWGVLKTRKQGHVRLDRDPQPQLCSGRVGRRGLPSPGGVPLRKGTRRLFLDASQNLPAEGH